MSWRFAICFAAVMLIARPATAIQVPSGLDDCASLEICLQLIDQVVPARDDGEGSNAGVLASKLHRFGDAAKSELLKRATGNHPGWRNVAGAILSEWHSWTPADVPELREALRKQPGGWVARSLGEIGSSEAIQALVEDLPKGNANQTDFALKELGAKAIPYLVPLLENNKNASSASRIIREMNTAALPFASKWATQAADPKQPVQARLGALRGIAAIGDKGRVAQPLSPKHRHHCGCPTLRVFCEGWVTMLLRSAVFSLLTTAPTQIGRSPRASYINSPIPKLELPHKILSDVTNILDPGNQTSTMASCACAPQIGRESEKRSRSGQEFEPC